MEYRPLGNTGFAVSRIGAGDVADRTLSRDTCVQTLQRALQNGVNLVDTAPGYEDGFSEEIVGVAVAQQRDSVFVISKIDDFALPLDLQLSASLDRLQMRYLDGYVYHGLSDMQTYCELRDSPDGFAALQQLKARGLVGSVGISSHHPDVLMQAMRDELCDIVMFPVGPFVDARYLIDVLPEAKARNIGTVCFKTFGAGKLVTDTTGYGQPIVERPRGKRSAGVQASSGSQNLDVAACVHFTLSHDPDVALIGMSYPSEQDLVWDAYRSFVPKSAEQLADIAARAAVARQGKGPCWWNPDPDA